MKVKDVLCHFQSAGTWVDWRRTCDQVLHGDPEAEVVGIATAWTATNAAIGQAADYGANLFITHEPAFCDQYRGTSSGDRLAAERSAMVAMARYLQDRYPDIPMGYVDVTFRSATVA